MEFYIILSHCQLPGDSPSKIEYMHLCWHLAVLMSMLLEENVFGESELMVFYLLPLFLVSQATICKEKMIIKKKKGEALLRLGKLDTQNPFEKGPYTGL